MYEEIKSIELSGELNINELYNLLKTNSSHMNLEIYSKLQIFSTAEELFKHFMNEDIKTYYQKTDNFIQLLSSIINHKNNIFDSKTDQYISDFSYILVLMNIISKLNNSLTEILKNTKNTISDIYEKYNSDLDKSSQEKYSELIDCLLNKYSSIDIDMKLNSKSGNKLYMSKSSTKENSNGSLDHNAQYLLSDAIYENKEFLLGKENINVNNTNKNNSPNFINETPRFKNVPNVNPSSNNNNNYNNNSDEKNNDIDTNMNSNSNLNLKKQTSFDSVFTLSQNINNNNNNSNGNEKENIINKSINITSINNNNSNNKDNTKNKENNENKESNESNDINQYITNIQKDVYFTKSSKRRQSCRFKSYKSNLTVNKINRNKSIDMCNNANYFSSLKNNNNNSNSHDDIKSTKYSSGHLFISNESKMYADLFEIIIELYKCKKITLEQKLKLKKLIISKNPQILNVHKYFDVDNEKFVKELKKIIQ